MAFIIKMDVNKKAEASKISEVLRQGGRRKRVGPILLNFGHAKLNPDAAKEFEVPNVLYEFKSKNDEVQVGTAPNINVNLRLNKIDYSSEAPSVKQINLARPY